MKAARISVREVDTLDDLVTHHHDIIMKIYQLGKNLAAT